MGDHNKNRSYNALTEGASASSAVAVGIVSAWRGDEIKSDVALRGKIMPNDRIEAAARAQLTTLQIPRGQLYTADWDLSLLARR